MVAMQFSIILKGLLKMEIRIITECYFDTMLIERIVQNKKIVWHRQGCNNVVQSLKEKKLLNHFKIGVIDKDKQPLQYLSELQKLSFEGFDFYWDEKNKSVVIIQLSPPLEKWILNVCSEEGIDLSALKLPKTLNEIRNYTKRVVVGQTTELRELTKKIINTKNEKVERLTKWLQYLIETKNNFDINYIKNV